MNEERIINIERDIKSISTTFIYSNQYVYKLHKRLEALEKKMKGKYIVGVDLANIKSWRNGEST